MIEKTQQRSLWKSPFKIGLAILSGVVYATACILETRLPGDSEWLYCYSAIFIFSFIVVTIEPARFLETAAMPLFAVMLLGLTLFGSPFVFVACFFVLCISITGAFLGSASRRIADVVIRHPK